MVCSDGAVGTARWLLKGIELKDPASGTEENMEHLPSF